MHDDDWLDERIEEDIRQRQQLDLEWQHSEAPYMDPTSKIALFPNPQDIIMGRNKAVAMTWTGNIIYHDVVQRYANRYLETQNGASDRMSKTLISLEILEVLREQYKSRFLIREDTRWVMIPDSEAQRKISQSLRTLAREIMVPK